MVLTNASAFPLHGQAVANSINTLPFVFLDRSKKYICLHSPLHPLLWLPSHCGQHRGLWGWHVVIGLYISSADDIDDAWRSVRLTLWMWRNQRGFSAYGGVLLLCLSFHSYMYTFITAMTTRNQKHHLEGSAIPVGCNTKCYTTQLQLLVDIGCTS